MGSISFQAVPACCLHGSSDGFRGHIQRASGKRLCLSRYPEGMAKRRQRVISSGVLRPVLQGRQVVGREKPSLRVMHASRGAGQLRSEAAPSLLLLRYGEELETAQSNFSRASTLFARFLTRLR